MMEKFHYHREGKPEIVLPKFGTGLRFGFLRKIRKEDAGEQLFAMLEYLNERKLITDKTLDLIDDLEDEQVQALMEAWQKDAEQSGDPTLGES